MFSRLFPFISLLFLVAGCVPDPEVLAMTDQGIVPLPSPAPSDPARERQAELFRYANSRGLPADGVLLLVTVDDQRLHMVVKQTTIASFSISTSAVGIGNAQNSYRTPLGFHEVCERYGDNQPAGRVFRSRMATTELSPPETWQQDAKEDLVLSRILRLRGLEPGRNAGQGIDSYERCIYLHGTNEEHRIGTPASHGCIRMRNRDVIDLFQSVATRQVWCLILETINTPTERAL
jgi:lipoprotein-anchoring transpeptidase ErfK/SrfK